MTPAAHALLLLFHLLLATARAHWRWLMGTALILAIFDGIAILRDQRLGPVSTFESAVYESFFWIMWSVAAVALAFGRPTRERLWPFLHALPVSTSILLAAHLAFVGLFVIGIGVFYVLAHALLGRPVPTTALTLAVLSRVVVSCFSIAAVVSSIWLMPRVWQFLGIATIYAASKLDLDVTPFDWPLDRNTAFDDQIPWRDLIIMMGIAALTWASCLPSFHRRLAERFSPRPILKHFNAAWACVLGALLFWPDASPSTAVKATVPPPASSAGLPSAWPELLPGTVPTVEMARALDGVGPTLELLRATGHPVPRIVVTRRDGDLGIQWLTKDVVVVSMDGDIPAEMLAGRLVNEVISGAVPADVHGPLGVMVGWHIDDQLPSSSRRRRLVQIEHRASCSDLSDRIRFNTMFPVHAYGMAAAFYADVVDAAGDAEAGILDMLRALSPGGLHTVGADSIDHLLVASAATHAGYVCRAPPSAWARVVERPSWPVAVEVLPLGTQAATMIVRVDEAVGGGLAWVTFRAGSLTSLQRPVRLAHITAPISRLRGGVPLGKALPRGSVVKIEVGSVIEEHDVQIEMLTSHTVVVP